MPRARRSFNSRTPGGVRRSANGGLLLGRCFNSRTPGGVRRMTSELLSWRTTSFNSRTPGGVRPESSSTHNTGLAFQFTHPGRGATESGSGLMRVESVSIHAPREGCDERASPSSQSARSFNSRTPGGVRQCGAKLRIIGRINKRNLREGEEEGRQGIHLLLRRWLCG